LREILPVSLVAVFGAVGAVSRYLVSGWAYQLLGARFAYGTLAVNVIGCFLLALLVQVVESDFNLSPHLRTALAIGFLGAFTTFSTFGYETFYYAQERAWLLAILNVLANLVFGLLAVWVGFIAGRALVGGA